MTPSVKNIAAIGNSCFWWVIFFKIFSSETVCPNEPQLCSICSNLLTNIPDGGNSCFWWIFFLIFSSEMSHKNEPKLGRQHVYKVLHKENKVTATLFMTKTVNTSVFVIYRRRKFVFAIRLGSIQTSDFGIVIFRRGG